MTNNSHPDHRHEKWQTILTAMLVLVGVVYTAAAIFQWLTMKEQSKVISQQLTVTKDEIESNKANRSADLIFRFDDRIYKSSLSEIRTVIEQRKPILKTAGGKFEADELDRYLDVYETMHDLYKKGLMSDEMIDSAYGHVLQSAYENPEIQRYLADIRKEDPDYYSGFEELAKLMIARKSKPQK